MELLEWFTPLNTFLCAIITAMATATITLVTRQTHLLSLIRKSHEAQLRLDISQAHDRYVVEGHYMSDATYHMLEQIHETYHALGGNGSEERWWGELREVGPVKISELEKMAKRKQ